MALPTLAPDEGFTKFPNDLRAAPWRNEPKTVAVYFFLRMNAVHFPSGWNCIPMEPGQILSGRAQIAAETGLTQNEVRTALEHLKRTGYITIKTTNKYSVFSFVDKENWGCFDECTTSSPTSESTSRPPADHQQTTTLKRYRDTDTKETVPRKRFSPPSVDEVAAYCQERGNTVDAQTFCDFYAAKGWRVGAQPMKDWRAAVRTWEKRDGGKEDRRNDRRSDPFGGYGAL